MATKVSYKIGGTYDSKGEKSAISGLNNLTKAAKTFNNAIKGFVGAAAIKALSTAVSGATETFNEQNKALINYNKALQNNLKISASGAKKLNTELTKLSRNNFFDGDSLNNAAALASNMGLDDKQIKEVIAAATELNAAGIMPLDQAVKSLSQTYSGNVLQLKKMVPELGNLTKEELANGEAVKKIQEVYAGYADTMAATFSGRNTQYNNNISDLKASIGAITSSLNFLKQGVLNEIIPSITNWLVENRNAILNFVIRLPEVIKAAVSTIKDMVAKTFTFENLVAIFKALFKTINTQIESTFRWLNELFYNLAGMISNIFSDLINGFTDSLVNGFNFATIELDNGLIKVIKGFGEKFLKILQMLQNPATFTIEAVNAIAKGVANNKRQKAEGKTSEEISKQYVNSIIKASGDFGKEFSTNLKDFTKDLKDVYGDNIEAFTNDISTILGKELPEDLKFALGQWLVTSSDTSTTEEDTSTGVTASSDSALSSFTDQVYSLDESFISMLTSIDSVNSILNWSTTLMDGIKSVLEPVVNSLLDPLVGFISMVGEMLGNIIVPSLQALSPIFEVLYDMLAGVLNIFKPIIYIMGAFLSTCLTPLVTLVNVLLIILDPVIKLFEALSGTLIYLINKVINPIARALLSGIDFVLNGLINGINAFIRGINKAFGWAGVNLSTLNKVNYAGNVKDIETTSYTAADLASAGSSASTGSSSYTGARDIIVNVNYMNSYVNGDARQIALSIYSEIKAAEALGY